MLDMAPARIPPPSPRDRPQVFAAEGPRRRRVALMTGCAQRALNTDINDATIRLLTRHGCEVVVAEGAGCCGSLTTHMAKTSKCNATAAKNMRAWVRE
jgi:glycolate oxidase iron-sulfur subunit